MTTCSGWTRAEIAALFVPALVCAFVASSYLSALIGFSPRTAAPGTAR